MSNFIAKIDAQHRKELLRFLLLKTSAVRSGVKPGELLRVRHCYQCKNADGFQFCLYRKDILEILRLRHLELRNDDESSLVLFFHPETLTRVLKKKENREILKQCSYPDVDDTAAMLEFLQHRFSVLNIPHEVGVFIGYPAKDVNGFINNLPRTPVHRGSWAVFGDTMESLRWMNIYRAVEKAAEQLLDVCDDLQTFFSLTANLNTNPQEDYNG